jgi:hypothetical protein
MTMIATTKTVQPQTRRFSDTDYRKGAGPPSLLNLEPEASRKYSKRVRIPSSFKCPLQNGGRKNVPKFTRMPSLPPKKLSAEIGEVQLTELFTDSQKRPNNEQFLSAR